MSELSEEQIRQDERLKIVERLRKVAKITWDMIDDPRFEKDKEKLIIRKQEINFTINIILAMKL